MLSWNSLKINDYIQDVHDHLAELELLNKQVYKILHYSLLYKD